MATKFSSRSSGMDQELSEGVDFDFFDTEQPPDTPPSQNTNGSLASTTHNDRNTGKQHGDVGDGGSMKSGRSDSSAKRKIEAKIPVSGNNSGDYSDSFDSSNSDSSDNESSKDRHKKDDPKENPKKNPRPSTAKRKARPVSAKPPNSRSNLSSDSRAPSRLSKGSQRSDRSGSSRRQVAWSDLPNEEPDSVSKTSSKESQRSPRNGSSENQKNHRNRQKHKKGHRSRSASSSSGSERSRSRSPESDRSNSTKDRKRREGRYNSSSSGSSSSDSESSRSRSSGLSESEGEITDVSPLASPDMTPVGSPRRRYKDSTGQKRRGTTKTSPRHKDLIGYSNGHSSSHRERLLSSEDAERMDLRAILQAVLELDKPEKVRSERGRQVLFEIPQVVKKQQNRNYSFSNNHAKDIDRENQRLLDALLQKGPGKAKKKPKEPQIVRRIHSSALNRQKEQRKIEQENQVRSSNVGVNKLSPSH